MVKTPKAEVGKTSKLSDSLSSFTSNDEAHAGKYYICKRSDSM